ncbi:TetR/AcrR family transcriptional regulator [Paratractidigestivibacter sp.]|uniref:TetR/AcrR family transcriptional regulator n=1 Tax=Paratractidigestivibacter sp. TaxID=2847316 RepID=UPI002AC930C4|nr:TetR/AcrR family transcriptional regulator [Paratractidigestivibacter sp.]
MLREKDLSKITVTDIVKRADINRATFYAHYPDVRGVTEEIENEIIAKMLGMLKEFEFTDFFRNPAPLLLELSRSLEEDAEFYRILIKANGSEIFMEKLKKCFTDYMLNDSDIPEDMRHSKMVRLRVCYFAGGIVNLYKQWFRGDLDCSLNDIAMEVSKLLQLEARELF